MLLQTYLKTVRDFELDEKMPQLTKKFKNWQKSETKKQSLVFSRDQIGKFFSDAPNDYIWLPRKVVAALGLLGTLRKSELVAIDWHNVISEQDHGITIQVTRKKTSSLLPTNFIIPEDATFGGVNIVALIRQYIGCFQDADREGRFFRRLSKAMKATRNPMGVNNIGSVPCEIATFLQLENPKQYTGHCLRKTSATLIADSGSSLATLQRAGGWRSQTVAEGYIAESLSSKNEIAHRIADASVPSAAPSASVPISPRNAVGFFGLSGCTFINRSFSFPCPPPNDESESSDDE